MSQTFLLLLCLSGSVYLLPMKDENLEDTCGYESCYPTSTQHGFLNVHIVPHTHDDVGWLKTVDQYYYGSRNNLQKAGVKYILDSVITELWKDPKRRFIYVETAFFWKWWVQQTKEVQQRVHSLVRSGRLQMVGGAWSMNDEAASHYQSTVDQFTWGLSKLNQTFGKCGRPHVGWQIDPFGHSREFASLLAMMGYDGLFLGRIDFQDKANRQNHKNMEMVWRGDDNLGKSSDIFTSVLHNTYSPPLGFCFDILCNDEPVIDDPNSPLYNVESRINDFLNLVRKQALFYRTNNIILTMGDDFQYQDAHKWYDNLDKLIKYANLKSAKERYNITLFYSTPDCYLKAVKDSNPTLPTKQDDFFPNASDQTAYWTGFYTSRPTIKYFEREGNNYLQMVKQLQVLADLEKNNQIELNELKSAMGIMQHHDAITGTEKQHVTHDYERILNKAIDNAMIIANQAFNKMTQRDAPKPPIFDFKRCHLNESRCDVSETSEKFVVTIYNPLGWSVREPIRIPVPQGTYEVRGPNGLTPRVNTIVAHLYLRLQRCNPKRNQFLSVKLLRVPRKQPSNLNQGKLIRIQMVDIPKSVSSIPTRTSKATHEIVFITKLKPISYKSYYIKKIMRVQHTAKSKKKYEFLRQPKRGIESLENQFYKLNIDTASGLIKQVTLPNHSTLNLTVNMYYYFGSCGDNKVFSRRSSGAYIFRPINKEPTKLTTLNTEVVKGEIVKEFRVNLSPNGYINTKLYNNLNFIETEWVVGPVSIADNKGKEYVIKYETNILNNGEFFTDSNGRQMLKRKLNYRSQWNVTLQEPVAGNYFPVTNEIYIENDDYRVSVLTDRSEGGTSLVEGDIELMLHRRLLCDDGFGVGEALNETAKDIGLVVRGKHRIVINKDREVIKKNVLGLHLSPHVLFSDASDIKYDEWFKLNNEYSWVDQELPKGLHLLTLEPWDSKLLIRIENYLEEEKKSDVQIDLRTIFRNIEIKSYRETMLAANMWVDEHKKWSWKTENKMENVGENISENDDFKITLKAKQIRTFIVEYNVNS